MGWRYSGAQVEARMLETHRLKTKGYSFEEIAAMLSCSPQWAKGMYRAYLTSLEYHKYFGLRGERPMVKEKRAMLEWCFVNGHKWHREFPTQEEAQTAALDFGLYTHPQIEWVNITEVV